MTLIPAPRSLPLESSSTLRSSRNIDELDTVFDEDLRKVASFAQRLVQHPLEDGCCDEIGGRLSRGAMTGLELTAEHASEHTAAHTRGHRTAVVLFA